MKRIYVDMDGVLADFYNKFRQELLENPRQPYPQSRYGFFKELEPIPDAIASFKLLQQHYDVWILTRPSIPNLGCYSDKAYWLKKHFGEELLHKTIMSPDKSLVKGDYLIDDQLEYGQTEFEGELIHFGNDAFPNWKAVIDYLIPVKIEKWILKYNGTGEFQSIERILKGADIEIIDNNFPTLLVKANNSNIGNLQHFPEFKVYPYTTYQIPDTKKKLKV